MPYSPTKYDNEIREFVLSNFPDLRTRILDIGAGDGKMRDLLYDYRNMDAVEAWHDNVVNFRLKERYINVAESDVMSAPIEIFKTYDLIIMGDVLEHLDTKSAQKLIASITGTIIVSVPYQLEQDEIDGNPWQVHKQPDLTHELFIDRYPGFRLMIGDTKYGIYVSEALIKNHLRMPKTIPMNVDLSKLRGLKIAVGTPLLSGDVSIKYAVGLVETVRRFMELGIEIEVLSVTGYSICQSRNRLVATFMSDPTYTHMMFIDADHGWMPNNILRLLTMDKDIVGVVARKKIPGIKWASNIPEGEVLIDETGAMELDDLGTGFALMRREVYTTMFRAYPKYHIVHPEIGATAAEKENYYRLYEFEIDEHGVERSEDITFCRRWRELGGKVYCDPVAAISHIGVYDFRGSISSLFMGEVNEDQGDLRQING